jgi:hypothetical protein
VATEALPQGRGAEPEIAGVVRALLDVLGEALVAVTASVDDAGLVRQWARGEATPPAEIAQRLRDSLDVVNLLLEREAPATVRAWWMGMNPDLGEEAPALVLHTRPDHVRIAALAHLGS